MDEVVNLVARLVGGAEVAAGAKDISAGVRGIGESAAVAKREAGALGTVTTGILRPFRYLKEEAFGLAKGMAAAGLAFGSVEGIKHAIETTDSLVKTTVSLHNQFGLTIQSASSLGAVLQTRNLQPQGLQMGLVALAKQMGQAAHGSASAQGAFRHFGISAADVRKALHGKDGLSGTFETIVDGLTKMHGGQQKAVLGQQLLGRASRGLAPLMQQGALSIKQQERWARQYGDTLNEKTVKGTEQMVAAQTQAQYAMQGLQIQMGMFAAPLVTRANLALADIVQSFRTGHATGGQFARTVYQVGTALKPLGKDLLEVGGYLKDHPKLLEAAALAWLGYKTKVLKILSFAPKAYAEGLLAGRAYRVGFEEGSGGLSAPGLGPGGAGGTSLLRRLLGGTAGRALLGVGLAHELARHVLHSHNMDPLDVLNPTNAGFSTGGERAHLRAMQHHGGPATPVRLRNGVVVYESPGDQAIDPNIRHVTLHGEIHMDGQKVGVVVAPHVAKAAQDAAARRHR